MSIQLGLIGRVGHSFEGEGDGTGRGNQALVKAGKKGQAGALTATTVEVCILKGLGELFASRPRGAGQRTVYLTNNDYVLDT